MSEITMLSRLLLRYTITIERRRGSTTNSDDVIRLTTWDPWLDTTTVYEGSLGAGVSALVVRAYANYRGEHES